MPVVGAVTSEDRPRSACLRQRLCVAIALLTMAAMALTALTVFTLGAVVVALGREKRGATFGA